MFFTTFRSPHFTFDRPLCRLGLATRGSNPLTPADIGLALDRGVNFLNWCGTPDGLSETIAGLGPRRREVMVCVQFEARTAGDARDELARIRTELNTDYVDVLTFYYVEEASEWEEIVGPRGALEYCREAQRRGEVSALGVTTHQRPLAAEMARGGLLDLLMIRYNAAHPGAEKEIFPHVRGDKPTLDMSTEELTDAGVLASASADLAEPLRSRTLDYLRASPLPSNVR